MFEGKYSVVVAGDKIFRSRDKGKQTELKSMKGVKRIYVGNRPEGWKGNELKMSVEVTITAYTQKDAQACFNKGMTYVRELIGNLKDTQNEPNTDVYEGEYWVPKEADKIFRSPNPAKGGKQAELKKNHKIMRIRVDDRENAKKNASGIDLVRVWITAPSKEIADACYQDGRKMVIALMEKAKKTPKLSDDEAFVKATIIIRDIIRFREERGEYDHMDDANISWYINWREERGITNHADLGMTDYEDPRPTLHFDYPLDDWGDYHEKLYLYQQANPDYNVIG